MRILTAYFARRCYSLMILLLFPNLIAVVQGQIKRCPFPGCGKPLSLCAYKGKHPAPKPKERHILFSVNRDDASALLYIDGIPKDSIYYGYNGRRGYDLKYGSHQVPYYSVLFSDFLVHNVIITSLAEKYCLADKFYLFICLICSTSSEYHSSPKWRISGSRRYMYSGTPHSFPFFMAQRQTSQRW